MCVYFGSWGSAKNFNIPHANRISAKSPQNWSESAKHCLFIYLYKCTYTRTYFSSENLIVVSMHYDRITTGRCDCETTHVKFINRCRIYGAWEFKPCPAHITSSPFFHNENSHMYYISNRSEEWKFLTFERLTHIHMYVGETLHLIKVYKNHFGKFSSSHV